LKLAIVKETRPDERRVAASPAVVARLVKAGWSVMVERGAGEAASFPDAQYAAAGASLVGGDEAWQADVVAKVRPPHLADGTCEADRMKEGALLVSFLFPAQNPELVAHLAARKISALGMDCIPRISRAQKLDAISSMANISGYRAVVEAANRYGSFFTGQFTAAGKVPPAKVLVIGAGVAGLAAVAAAKALGAIVRAFDVRPSVADQVKSLGGEFLTVQIAESGEGQGGYAKEMSKEFIDAEMALFREQAKDVNIVITTALIPGRPAPKLWTAEAVGLMKPGSVVIDLAAEQGGNCDLTVPGQAVERNGVTIVGFTDMPSRMASVASDLYGTNVQHLLDEMGGADKHAIDLDNDIVRGSIVLRHGEKLWPPPAPKKIDVPAPGPAAPVPAAPVPAAPVPAAPAAKPAASHGHGAPAAAPSRTAGIVMSVVGVVALVAWLALRFSAPDATVSESTVDLLQHTTVFVMAIFVGWQVIWNVSPALHTPLMSVTNAISGIIVVGGLLGARAVDMDASVIVAILATLFATINIAGGFLVTRRMLAMFRK
jgi:NAD(P) transhydrogenase subunit alpha